MFFRNILLCSCLGVAYLLILYVTELRLSLTLTKCFNGHLRHVSWMIHTMSFTPRSLNDSRYVIYATFPEWFTLWSCTPRSLNDSHYVIYATFPEWFTLWSSTPRSLNDSHYVIYTTFPEWFTLCHLRHVSPWMIHAMVMYATFPEWFTLCHLRHVSWMIHAMVIYATFPECLVW